MRETGRFKQAPESVFGFTLDSTPKSQIILAMERSQSEERRKLRRLHPEDAENIALKDTSTLSRLNINDTYSHFQDELTNHLSKLMDVLEQEKVKPQQEEKKVVKEKTVAVVVNATKEVKEDELYSFFKNLNIENRFSLEYTQSSESTPSVYT